MRLLLRYFLTVVSWIAHAWIRPRVIVTGKCATPKCHTTYALSLSINTVIIYVRRRVNFNTVYSEQYSENSCKSTLFSSVVHPDPDHDPAFQVNPGFWRKKIKGSPSYRRSLQPSKENIQYFKKWNLEIFLFVWVIFALWIRIRTANPDPDTGSRDTIESKSNPDPDPKHCFSDKVFMEFRMFLKCLKFREINQNSVYKPI